MEKQHQYYGNSMIIDFRLSPYYGFCCIFLCCGKLMAKPMHFPYAEVYHRMGIGWEKSTHSMGIVLVSINFFKLSNINKAITKYIQNQQQKHQTLFWCLYCQLKIYLTQYLSFGDFKHVMPNGILYCLNLKSSMHFRVGSRSPVTSKRKLHVTIVTLQPLAIFCHKELYLRCRRDLDSYCKMIHKKGEQPL